MREPTQNIEGINRLFDEVMASHKLPSDAKLSYLLEVAPPVISKQRAGKLLVGPAMILSLHERGGLPVKYIRKLLQAE